MLYRRLPEYESESLRRKIADAGLDYGLFHLSWSSGEFDTNIYRLEYQAGKNYFYCCVFTLDERNLSEDEKADLLRMCIELWVAKLARLKTDGRLIIEELDA